MNVLTPKVVRLSAWALCAVLMLAGLLAGAAWGLLATEAGTRWALSLVPGVQAESVRGTVLSELSVGQLTWQGQDAAGQLRVVQLQGLLLALQPMELLSGTLRIKKMQAQTVSLRIPPSADDSPLKLPDSIRLPIGIELESLKVNTLVFNGTEVQRIDSKASWRGTKVQLEHLNATALDTDVQLTGQLTTAIPYALQAKLTAEREQGALNLNALVALNGDLQNQLEASVQADGRHARRGLAQTVNAQALLKPLAPFPLKKLNAKGQSFNPADWWPGAPTALLDLDVQLRPDDTGTQVEGLVHLQNRAPQVLPAGGLPVASLTMPLTLSIQEGQLKAVDLPAIELQLAERQNKAGQVSAQVNWQNTGGALGQGELMLQAREVLPSLFHTELAAKPVQLEAQARVDQGRLVVEQLALQGGNQRVMATVDSALTGTWASKADINWTGLSPAYWLRKPPNMAAMQLEGKLSFSGNLKSSKREPESWNPSGRLQLDFLNSQIAQTPVVLKLDVQGSVARLDQVALNADVLGNTATVNGQYGQAKDSLVVKAQFPKLQALGRALGLKLNGTVAANANVSGQYPAVQAQGNLDVQSFRFADTVLVQSVQSSFAIGADDQFPWEVDLNVNGVGQPRGGTAAEQTRPAEDWVRSANIQVRGKRTQHTIAVKADTGFNVFSRQRALKLNLQMQGGVQPLSRVPGKPLGWSGVIQALRVEGLWSPARSLALQGASALSVAPSWVESANLVLQGEDGTRIDSKLAQWTPTSLKLEGSIPKFGVPRLSPILKTQVSVEPKDWVLAAQWRALSTPGLLDAKLDINHVSGGLQILEESQLDVPIQRMQAGLVLNRQSADLNVDLAAPGFGSLLANATLPVEKNAFTGTWGLAGRKPMQGSLAAAFSQLNWLGPMLSGGIRTQGSGQIAVALSGSVDEPDMQGRLFAYGLDVFHLDQGVRLEEGELVVDFNRDRARIEQAEFVVRHRQPPRRRTDELAPLLQGNGRVNAAGEWRLDGLNGAIQVKAIKAPLVQRSDRWVMLDATVDVTQPKVDGEPLKVRGDAQVLGAYIETPESGVPTLGDDVVIKGQTATGGAGLPLDVILQVRLGERAYLNAQGLKTRLDGGLRLTLQDGVGGSGVRRSGRRLAATGTIQAVDGTFRAYGQDLTIERGVVNFQGPLENPGLNVRAVRKGLAVEAGVEVTGTAQRPKVTLVSDPGVPDPEKLSWMIIGRGSNASDRDQTLLLTAAAALFGDDDESPVRKLAKRVGVDEFALTTGSLTAADSRAVGSKVAIAPGADVSATVVGEGDPLLSQRIVSLGKRLSNRLQASVEQSLTTTANIVKLNYQLSRQMSVIARTGADNALDVLYQISFD